MTNRRSWILATVSFSVLFSASAGLAQAPAGTLAEEASEDIVVTGVRASVQRAQAIKRDAPSVVEAVTFEDLGKFTDPSISDALQRVPGLNIERNTRGLENGDGVTIRGLGPSYLSSTLNGRELLGIPGFFGGGGRNFDYGAVPPEVLGGVLVYKTSSAELVEPGLAGQVDMKTLRPLDFRTKGDKTWFGSATAAGEYETNSEEIGPRYSGIIGGRFLNDTLGLYVSGLHSLQKTEQQTLYMYPGTHDVQTVDGAGNVTVNEDVNTIDGYSPANSTREYTKEAIAAGVQWRPSASLDINAEALYNRFETDLFNSGNDYYSGYSFFSSTTGGPFFTEGSYELRDGGLVYYDSNGITDGATPFNYAGYTHVINDNEFYNVGLNVAWDFSDGWTLKADLSRGESEYFQDWRSAYADNGSAGGTQGTFDGSGEEPVITFNSAPASNISDPNSYSGYGFFYFQSVAFNERTAFKLDLEHKWSDALSLKFGARYAETETTFVLAYGPNLGPIDSTGFFSGESETLPFYPTTTPVVSESGFCAANRAYCTVSNRDRGSFNGELPSTAEGSPDDVYDFVPGESYYVQEKNLAFYVQADAKGQVFGLDYAGNAGLRAVKIEELGRAFQGVEYRLAFGTGDDPNRQDETVLVEDTNEYWQYLPAVNLTLKPTEKVNLRFGIARTMSLAQYKDLAPRGTVLFFEPVNGADEPSQYNGGNTRLDPTMAWNYDFTTEYYTDYGGSYIVSLFYKDVQDLIINTTQYNASVPGYAGETFTVSAPVNSDQGYTYGFELGTNQPFTFLPAPWDGFGLTANYTYVDSSRDPVAGSTAEEFPGSSKHNVNASAYYEKYGFSARVALNYRSSYLYETGSGDGYTRDQTTVDASLSKDIRENFEIILTGSNLTGEDVKNYTNTGEFFRGFYERPTTYSLALRASF